MDTKHACTPTHLPADPPARVAARARSRAAAVHASRRNSCQDMRATEGGRVARRGCEERRGTRPAARGQRSADFVPQSHPASKAKLFQLQVDCIGLVPTGSL